MVSVMVTLLIGFSNCGRISTSNVMDATTLGRSICDTRLKKTFGETYHPFLATNCTSCHTHKDNFASADVNVAYNAFMSKSLTIINSKAVTQHGSNNNSAAYQPMIDAFQPKFKSALADYENCKVSDYGIDILLTEKSLPVLADHNGTVNAGWADLSWQVETESVDPSKGQQVRAFFKIQVRRYEATDGSVIGLQFRAPTLTLHSGQQALQVASLKLYVNGQSNDVVTLYQYLDAIVDTEVETPLAPGSGAAPLEMTITGDTKIAFELRGVGAPDERVDPSPVVPVPVDPGEPLPARVTYADLMATNSANNIFVRSCTGCHSAGNPQGGLDITNYAAASASATAIKERMNNAVNPMPRSGILDQRSRQIVDLWVDSGAPQN